MKKFIITILLSLCCSCASTINRPLEQQSPASNIMGYRAEPTSVFIWAVTQIFMAR
jgi:hypothetical protein